MPQEPHGSPSYGGEAEFPDATAPSEPGQFGSDRPYDDPTVPRPPSSPPPLPPEAPGASAPPTGAYGVSSPGSWPPPSGGAYGWGQQGQQAPWGQQGQQGQQAPWGQQQPPGQTGPFGQHGGWPQAGAGGVPPYAAGQPQAPQGFPPPHQQFQVPYGVGPHATPEPRRRSRRALWVTLGVIAALLILGGGLLVAMVGGQKAEARCTSSGCTLTLTKAGSGVDLTTVGGVRKVRQEGIEGDRATFSVDGQERSCRRGEKATAAGLTFACSAIDGETLTLQVSQ